MTPRGVCWAFSLSMFFLVRIWVLTSIPAEAAQGLIIKTVGVGEASSVSSDGQLITFTDWNTGKIMLRNLTNGETSPLTQGGYPDYGMYAQISPDGKQVAYSWRVHGGHFDLRIVDIDGSNPRVLLDGNARDETFFVMDWSPDGREILVVSQGLALVSVEYGTVRRIYSNGARRFTNWARFAPDGRQIAFDVRPSPMEPSGDILLYSLDKKAVLASLSSSFDDRLLDWMPGGKWLLFGSNRSGSYGLWGVRVNNQRLSEPVRLLDSLGAPWSVGISEEGSVFYSVRTWENHLYIAGYDPEKGSIGHPEQVAADVNYSSAPAWSPDGKYLAYSRAPSTLVLRSFPNGKETAIHYALRRFHSIRPHWSSDGKLIMLEARPNGTSAGLIAVDTKTGEVNPLVVDAQDGKVEWPTGSPAEKIYLPLYDVEENARIIERDMGTGNDREVFSFESNLPNGQQPVRMFALSPDGNMLGYLEESEEVGGTTAVKVRSVTGGEPRELFRLTRPQVLYCPAWTPDSRSLLFGVGSTNGTDSVLRIWQADVDSGETRQLKGLRLLGKNMGGLSIHPDGQRIAFTAGRIYPEGMETGTEVRDEVRVVEHVRDYLDRFK